MAGTIACACAATQPPVEASPAQTMSTTSATASNTLPPPAVQQTVTVIGLSDAGEDPTPCTECTRVSGTLPSETVERILHLNRARFRFCYAQGLQKDATLSGRVIVRFVIGRNGEVSKADVDPASTLASLEVRACLTDAFKALSFPQPEGGLVYVTYPLAFTPSPK
jgi:hypothetical protein